jgi:serine/threonine protein phosphatase PrpC
MLSRLETTSASDSICSDLTFAMTGDDKMSDEAGRLRLRLFGRTDVGQIREHNEDNFLVANLQTGVRGLMEENRTITVGPGGVVLGVCDGMGGAAAGEVASQMAVDLIYEQLESGGPAADRDDLARRLVQSIEHTGAQIFQDARADRSRRGMGTTATIATFLDERVFVGQVGDSRAYLLRQGKLALLSRDQSLVNQLIEAGQLTEEEAETFEHNNIILQALGTAEAVQVDLTYVDLCQGDVLMICSDGLSGMIRNDEIRDVLQNTPEPLDACRELTDRANAAGGHDNITVIVARVDGGTNKPSEASTFGYQKYALPDITPEASTVLPREERHPDSEESVPSEEAAREGRKLRVSHTMIGAVNPLAATPITSEVPTGLEEAAERSRRSGDARGESQRSSFAGGGSPQRLSRNSEEPVALPTTGFPPTLLGIIVTCTLLLAGLFGYLLVR